MSPPTMKVSSSSGRASCSLLRVSTVNERPGTSASTRETPSRSSPATAAAQSATRTLDARVVDRLLVRRRVHRHEQHAVEPELRPRLLRADEVADVRRVERPAEQPDPRH